MERRRIDTLLTERGLAGSRTSAAASVRAGRVRIGTDGPRATKPGQLVPDDAALEVEERPRHVSRGGLKLDHALDALEIDVEGRPCLDVGASAGGFTDCLLQRGAERVIALDVGHGQLDWGLRNDPRVHVIERKNARQLAPAGELLALVKPQFELGRGRVRGGVVRSADERREAIVSVAESAVDIGLAFRGFASSGLPGPKGNRETFLWCAAEGRSERDVESAAREVEP